MQTTSMPFRSDCDEQLFTTQLPHSLILEKLRWESGPTSIPDHGEIIPIIENARRELAECEAQIKALESRRDSLRIYTNQLQALFSPVRKIPGEILQHIFDDCCDVAVVQPPTAHMLTGNRPAMALSGVCSRWRRNALSLPAIWSRISVVCVHQNPKLIDIFLDRALQHPLTVSIELKGPYRRYQDVLTRLFNSTNRWYSFTFKSRSFGLGDLFSACNPSLVQYDFPLLEFLHILDANSPQHLDFFFHKARKLKKLMIPLIHANESLSEHTLFGQLTCLEFCRPFNSYIQTLVDSGHRLVSLKTEESVHIVDNDRAVPMSPTPCSTIHTLTIRHHAVQRTGCSIFPYLTLPVLKTIHLEGDRFQVRRYDWTNFDPFVAFLSRSSCPLTTLSIECLALADLKLVDLLTQLPTLQHLSIDDSYVEPEKSPITGQFIESLQVNLAGSLRGQTNIVVPRLHSLKLNIGALIFEDTSIVDMVASRWIPDRRCSANGVSNVQVDCMREFTVTFRDREEIKGVYEPLENLERNGLRAVVLWQTGGNSKSSNWE